MFEKNFLEIFIAKVTGFFWTGKTSITWIAILHNEFAMLELSAALRAASQFLISGQSSSKFEEFPHFRKISRVKYALNLQGKYFPF